MIKLIFIRHGESEKNIKDINSCSLNKYPLTEKGRSEVKKMVGKITEKIDFIFVSPMLRARETAEILNKKFKVELIIDPLLSEYDYGEWNDKTNKYLLENNVDYRKYKQLKSKEDKFNYKLGRIGESRKEIGKRIRKFINKIIKEYSDKNILVVSHGGINAAICRALNNCNIDEYFIQEGIDYNTIQLFIIE